MSTQPTVCLNRPRFTASAAIPCAKALGHVVRKNFLRILPQTHLIRTNQISDCAVRIAICEPTKINPTKSKASLIV
jgi:hypothetical protein